MGIGDLDSGASFGLPPIGLPQSHLDTPGSDTERRAFPGLATKSSVFAWSSDTPQLLGITFTAPPLSGTINLRRNTAGGGVSVDVPTWAAGAVIMVRTYIDVIGVGITYHQFVVNSVIDPASIQELEMITHNVINQVDMRQLIVPFYDEPLINYSAYNNLASALGSENITITLIGFVRNV